MQNRDTRRTNKRSRKISARLLGIIAAEDHKSCNETNREKASVMASGWTLLGRAWTIHDAMMHQRHIINVRFRKGMY